MSHQSNKYSLVVCELYNKNIHGLTEESDKNIQEHYLVMQTFNPENINMKKINNVCKRYNRMYCNLDASIIHNHPVIRNYPNIVTGNKYIQPQIAERIYLSGDECVAVIKTHWIRLIQRNWRRVYSEQQRIYGMRKHPRQLQYRQVTGNWSNDCARVPSLRGMLGGL